MYLKKLATPEFRITIGDVIIQNGIQVECFSSREEKADWCRVVLDDSLEGRIAFQDMERAVVELGYDDDFDTIIDGYIRKASEDYWKEVIIKDDMMKLERCRISATFMQCTAQDIIRYILTSAGISQYQLSDKDFEQREKITIPASTGISAIKAVNNAFEISVPYYVRDGIFYWGIEKEQKEIYVLDEGNSIINLEKLGNLWEAETVGIPWIHHSEVIEVSHTKISGTFGIEKVIIKGDETGSVRQYIYFKGA